MLFEVATLSTCRRNTCVEEVKARIHWEPTMDEFGDADAGTNGQVVERSAMRVPVDLVRYGRLRRLGVVYAEWRTAWRWEWMGCPDTSRLAEIAGWLAGGSRGARVSR